MDLFTSLFGRKSRLRRSSGSPTRSAHLAVDQLEGRLVLSATAPAATPTSTEWVAQFSDLSTYANTSDLTAKIPLANGQTANGQVVQDPADGPDGYEVIANLPPNTVLGPNPYAAVTGPFTSNGQVLTTDYNLYPAATPSGDLFNAVTSDPGQQSPVVADDSGPTDTPTTTDLGTPGTGVTDPGTQLQGQLQQNAGGSANQGSTGNGATGDTFNVQTGNGPLIAQGLTDPNQSPGLFQKRFSASPGGDNDIPDTFYTHHLHINKNVQQQSTPGTGTPGTPAAPSNPSVTPSTPLAPSNPAITPSFNRGTQTTGNNTPQQNPTPSTPTPVPATPVSPVSPAPTTPEVFPPLPTSTGAPVHYTPGTPLTGGTDHNTENNAPGSYGQPNPYNGPNGGYPVFPDGITDNVGNPFVLKTNLTQPTRLRFGFKFGTTNDPYYGPSGDPLITQVLEYARQPMVDKIPKDQKGNQIWGGGTNQVDAYYLITPKNDGSGGFTHQLLGVTGGNPAMQKAWIGVTEKVFAQGAP